MKLTESKLRQIIIEEVADRLLEQIIEEELDRFLLENDLEGEDDLEDYKKAYKKDLISKVKKTGNLLFNCSRSSIFSTTYNLDCETSLSFDKDTKKNMGKMTYSNIIP